MNQIQNNQSKVEININDLLKQNADYKLEIEKLKRELDYFKRIILGKKSERYISEEAPLPPNTLFTQMDQEAALSITKEELENATEETTITVKRIIKKSGGGKELPAHLHREITVIEPEEKTDDMKCIGRVVTEELEYTPGIMHVNRIERPKYIDSKTTKIIIAPMPSRPVEKCIVGPKMMSDMIIKKYEDHLPLYRQIQAIKRNHQVDLSRSTVGNWNKEYIEVLEPLYEALQKLVYQSHYIQNDESTIKVQTEATKENPKNIHLGYMWVSHAHAEKIVYFSYQKGRSGESFRSHLPQYKGLLQTDGYNVYEQIRYDDQITLLSCWAHALRKFDQARSNDPKTAEYVLKEIQKLYNIERQAKEDGITPEQRKEVRQSKSKEILEHLEKYLNANSGLVLPSSAIGIAIEYTIKRWTKLVEYINHGEAEIDNNIVENSIRPLALGRKNYLFAGSHDSAQRSAMMYSFIGTCKINGINPTHWLYDIFLRIKDHPINKIEELLPQNWTPLVNF